MQLKKKSQFQEIPSIFFFNSIPINPLKLIVYPTYPLFFTFFPHPFQDILFIFSSFSFQEIPVFIFAQFFKEVVVSSLLSYCTHSADYESASVPTMGEPDAGTSVVCVRQKRLATCFVFYLFTFQ